MSTRQRSAERTQFLTDLLITAIEGGIQYWAYVTAYHPDQGSATIEPKDNESTAHHITLATISRGIRIARAKGLGSSSGQDYVGMFWLANRTNGEDGDYDAEIADQIVQFGLFGEGVYG